MTRIDPDKNMRRFYQLRLTEDLFGRWRCVHAWGRIGRRGRSLEHIFDTQEEAASEIDKWFAAKRKRGYM